MTVVRLELADRSFHGTGFIVYASMETCLVMTCHHVFPNTTNIQVAFPGETTTFPATRLHTGPADLALFRFNPNGRQCVALRFAEPNSTALNYGQVRVVGYYSVPTGRVLNPGIFQGKIISEPSEGFIICDYPTENGASGSPVFKGNVVVGVNSHTRGGIKHAVSVEVVRRTLLEWLGSQDNTAGIERMLAELAQKV